MVAMVGEKYEVAVKVGGESTVVVCKNRKWWSWRVRNVKWKSQIFVVLKVQAINFHFQVTCSKIHIPQPIHVQLP